MQLGWVVFLLIANISDTVTFEENITCGPFEKLVLDPELTCEVAFDGSQIVVSDLSAPELLWEKVNKLAQECRRIQKPLGDKEGRSFAAALDTISKDEYAQLVMPASRGDLTNTLLDQIAITINKEANSYATSLEKWIEQPSLNAEFNNVLRIAYNFASEADALISLLISVCDLKPIVFWSTIYSHWQLRQAFRELPWTQLSGKPSFKKYESSIKGARNAAFHDLLPVSKKLVADLQGVSLGARTLTLFSQYSGKNGNQFDYEDKELVEVLTRFTHAEQKIVSKGFWVGNEGVIRASAELARSMANALKTLYAARGASLITSP